MSKVTVTLSYKENAVDLELPSSVPFNQITPILFRELGWHSLKEFSEPSTCGARNKTSGIIVEPSNTLDAAGVVDGDLLELTEIDLAEPAVNPEPAPASTEGDHFVCAKTGKVFPIRRRASLIGWGRHFPIDLSTLPDSDWVSSEHANLIRRVNLYEVKDLNSRHGTIVDGNPIVPGKLVQLRDGTRIQFGGDNGPILILRITNPEIQDSFST